MRRFALVVPALLLAGSACSSPESAPPEVNARPSVGERALARLDLRPSLAGRDLEEVADGPWVTRRVARSGPGNEAAGVEGGAEDRETADGPDDGRSVHAFGGAREKARASAAPGAPPATSPASASGAPSPRKATARPGDSHGGESLDRAEAKSLDKDGSIAVSGGAGGYFREPGGPKPAGDVAVLESVAQAGPLRAGKTDDNADYAPYLDFLATWVDRKEIQSLYQPTDVSERHFLRVVDASGRPIPGAIVSVVDEMADRVLWSGTTYGDGVVAYYPNLVPGARSEPGAPLTIEAYVRDSGPEGAVGTRMSVDGIDGDLEIVLTETIPAPDTLALDVCFVIDTTGSMSDEIASIKASLLSVTDKLRGLGREFDLRYSAVLYRDLGDDYVTATHPFTSDIVAFDAALREVGANGGGDTPESLNQALAQAVEGVAWRPEAAKVAFLVADAPPHMDYDDDVPYGESARAALAKGIRLHAVAASGLDPVGTLVFRQIAQLGRGKFVFIEYGSPEASAESHGVAGKVESDNLDDILFEQIRDELATFGRASDR